ncbi:sensor histidine kinase [Sporosarcina beigongshangi]|uniref:sensor histidine kinase n=1 Tax=Sporosarcina beigongshangi TaxID=2782538 RepID=UPI00193A0A69|nr:sensor histidine kinase [Sporosarcina beigongshangi]
MFRSYLKDMASWISFFLLSLGFADMIIWLDQGIDTKFSSVLYVNILLIIALILFVYWRYRKEMTFTKELVTFTGGSTIDWHEALPESPFKRDEITKEVLQVAALSFSEKLATIKQANVIESDYTAAWIHEVKAPLTAMKLLIDAHRTDPAIRKLEAEWLRVYLLIDQQLYISRLPTLESDYLVEATAIQRLAAAEVRELATWCMEKNIAVEFEGEDARVVTDVKWSRFIIRQILTNAVKYSSAGSTICILTSIKSNGNVALTIKDEGPGIKSHDLPRIFDKGFTGGAGRLQNAATGLGLYLAKTVADKLGITLAAESIVNQGTTITMIFPTENEFDSIQTPSKNG